MPSYLRVQKVHTKFRHDSRSAEGRQQIPSYLRGQKEVALGAKYLFNTRSAEG